MITLQPKIMPPWTPKGLNLFPSNHQFLGANSVPVTTISAFFMSSFVWSVFFWEPMEKPTSICFFFKQLLSPIHQKKKSSHKTSVGLEHTWETIRQQIPSMGVFFIPAPKPWVQGVGFFWGGFFFLGGNFPKALHGYLPFSVFFALGVIQLRDRRIFFSQGLELGKVFGFREELSNFLSLCSNPTDFYT